jgi:transcriptional regulator with XRE-family HTH domain
MLETYKNIKRLRLERGWTQGDLAKLTGYADKTAISKIENGRIDLTTRQIKKFADVFGVSPSDIMGNDGIAPQTIEIPHGVVDAMRNIREKAMSEAGLTYSAIIPGSNPLSRKNRKTPYLLEF